MALTEEQKRTAGRARSRNPKNTPETKLADGMGNPPGTITLGGRDFRIQELNLGDLMRAEKDFGSSDEFFAQVDQKKIGAVAYLIWLQLRKTEPALTVEDAAELIPINPERLAAVMQQIMGAAGLGNAEPDPGNAEAPAP